MARNKERIPEIKFVEDKFNTGETVYLDENGNPIVEQDISDINENKEVEDAT